MYELIFFSPVNLSVSTYYSARQEKLKKGMGECLLPRQVRALKEFTDKMVREKLDAAQGRNHKNHRYSEDLQSQWGEGIEDFN